MQSFRARIMKLENACLLIIDVQAGMFSTPGLHMYDSDVLLGNIESLLSRAREAGFPIIYVQHESVPGGLLDPATPRWPFMSTIAPTEDEPVIHKKTPSAFVGTNLQQVLEERHLSTIVIAGVQSELCVDSTVRHATFLGYKVILVQDAHSTFDSTVLPASDIIAHENRILGDEFATLASTNDLEFA
jgi:nicotinamidase-related amidase